MALSRRKGAYLRAHFREFGDGRLARALDVSKDEVRKARTKLGLGRSVEENARIKEGAQTEPPRYVASAPLPDWAHGLTRGDGLTALGVIVAALAVYLLTLAPTVTGEDSGELITAAYTLGIPHPPGYPLWTMLGKLFTYIPFGTVGWRVNFMSAFFAAAAAGLTCSIAIKLSGRRVAGIVAGLAFAYSREFWEQSVIAEVYTLNAYLIALNVLLLLTWYETRQRGLLIAIAGVYGLGLCNHNTMMLVGPIFAAFILWVEPHWRRWPRYAGCIALAAGVFALIHVYMPLRSLADPPVDWGNPENWENFKDVVSRTQYSFMFTEDPRTVARFVRQAWMLGGFFVQQFTPWVAWLPLLGLPLLWKRGGGWRFGLMAALGVVLGVGYILVLNTKFEEESMWVATVFYIPFYMIAAIFMGLGLVALESLITHRKILPNDSDSHNKNQEVAPATSHINATRPQSVSLGKGSGETLIFPQRKGFPRLFIYTLALFAIASPLIVHWHHNDRSDDAWAYDYARNMFRTLDENAIYFPTSDHATFPCIYLQAVDGLRPDVTIANKYGYPEEDLYADMPEDLRAQFGKIPTEPEERVIEDWIIRQYPERPVYFTTKRAFDEFQLVPAGLAYRLVRPGEEAPERDYWAAYEWTTLDPQDTRGDYTAGLILGDVHFARARDHFAKGEKEAGAAELEKAVAATGGNKETMNNFGSMLAENGMMAEAVAYFERAIALDPAYLTPLRNLSKVYMARGDPEKALEYIDRLLEKRPMDYEAVWLRIDALQKAGRPDDAIAQLEDILKADPEEARAYRELGIIYLRDKSDRDMARAYLTQSLRINPKQPEVMQLLQRIESPTPFEAGPGVPGLPNAAPHIPRPPIP
jgi:tetratricopeptide (TPR) repeat protein